MVPLLKPQGDLGIVIRRGVRLFLAGQRKNDSSVVAADWRQFVRLFAAGDFDPRPLPPQVDAGGRLYHLTDVGAAHSRRAFQKIKLSVAAGANELGMRYPAH